MRIIGLTGSIGMGKSTAAAMLRRMRIPVYCADDVVHQLLGIHGAAVAAVAKLHPPAHDKKTNAIDRAILGKAVFHDATLMTQLEAILHPLVREQEVKFLQRCRVLRKRLVALDIPLLFETQAHKRVHQVMVVSAPSFIQRGRVLSRAGMTPEKLNAILKKQMPDAQKRKHANVVIPTGLGRAVTYANIRSYLRILLNPIK
ncbi:MAG: dephospho-CoA kinase [Alphaproteobacteria bacterium]|nr:dephospho-CoA kinase [Alphaproteobacteria bacterium]